MINAVNGSAGTPLNSPLNPGPSSQLSKPNVAMYTNPATANGTSASATPVSGIGSTPPVSLKKRKFSLKWLIVGLVAVILVVGLGVGLYLQGQSQNLLPKASGGSCQGGGSDNCMGLGRVNCGGRSESNCNAVSSCGCGWVSDNNPPPTQPPATQPPSNGGGGSSSCSGASGCSVTCTDGTHFADACPANGAFSTCSQWANQACGGSHGGVPGGNSGGGTGGGSGTCNSSAVTAVACRGVAVGAACPGLSNATCQRGSTASDGSTNCGCVINSGVSGLGNGQPCSTNSNCSSNNCVNNVCSAAGDGGSSTGPVCCLNTSNGTYSTGNGSCGTQQQVHTGACTTSDNSNSQICCIKGTSYQNQTGSSCNNGYTLVHTGGCSTNELSAVCCISTSGTYSNSTSCLAPTFSVAHAGACTSTEVTSAVQPGGNASACDVGTTSYASANNCTTACVTSGGKCDNDIYGVKRCCIPSSKVNNPGLIICSDYDGKPDQCPSSTCQYMTANNKCVTNTNSTGTNDPCMAFVGNPDSLINNPSSICNAQSTCSWNDSTQQCLTDLTKKGCTVGGTNYPNNATLCTSDGNAGKCQNGAITITQQCTNGKVCRGNTTSTTCVNACGDGICSPNETTTSCPADCGGNASSTRCSTNTDCASLKQSTGIAYSCVASPYGKYCVKEVSPSCGDHICEINETNGTCPEDCTNAPDCHVGGTSCGTGLTCNSAGLCVSLTAVCGNNICDYGENRATCSRDCSPSKPVNGGGGGSSTNPPPTGSNMCTNPGAHTIAQYQKYVCNKCSYTTGSDGSNAWRCDTLVDSETYPLHLNAGECGQVDQIDTAGNYCGYAQTDYNCDQSQCLGNPPSSPTPPPSGPQCLSIAITNISKGGNTIQGGPTGTIAAPPAIGDAVRFTCGTVAGANHYVFRVIQPDNHTVTLNATGATSVPYTISTSGKYIAQCQICTGTDASTCHAFEAIKSSSSTIQ